MRQSPALGCAVLRLDSWESSWIDADGRKSWPGAPGATTNPRKVLARGRTWASVAEELGIDTEPRNAYQERLELRRERLLERADKAEAEARAQERASREAVANIPLGQPILVGHHSERGHRRDLERSHRAMDRAVDTASKAARLRRRADAVGTAGISSDDPKAPAKLRAKLEALEASREKMKAANRPFPSYSLRNIGARIRDIRKRLEALEAAATAPAREIEGDGWRIVEDREANRLQVVFPAKPSEAIRTALKRAGFRWARSKGAWQRHISEGAWREAREGVA